MKRRHACFWPRRYRPTDDRLARASDHPMTWWSIGVGAERAAAVMMVPELAGPVPQEQSDHHDKQPRDVDKRRRRAPATAIRARMTTKGTSRRRRGGGGGRLGDQPREIVEQAVEVTSRGCSEGPVQAGLELGLVESPVGVVTGQLVGHLVPFCVGRTQVGVDPLTCPSATGRIGGVPSVAHRVSSHIDRVGTRHIDRAERGAAQRARSWTRSSSATDRSVPSSGISSHPAR